MREYIIKENESGIRLDKYLSLIIDGKYNFFNMMIRKKQIKINNVHAKDLKQTLNYNDNIKIYLNDEMFKKESSFNIDIIYEDENILILDKPQGMMVHDVDNNHSSLLDLTIKYLIDKHEYIPSINSFKPALCNRIDTNTSGLVVIGKTFDAVSTINKLILNNNIEKYYLCIACGIFEKKEDTLIDYLDKDDAHSLVKISKNGTFKIITKYEVLGEKDDLSLLKIKLETGRTHQIRAHLAFYKHPVLGDTKYGSNKYNKKYQTFKQKLVSYELHFKDIEKENYKYLNDKTFTSKMKLEL